MATSLRDMINRAAKPGRVEWIGLRPDRRSPMVPVNRADIHPLGLNGDHGTSEKRAVTLVQAEHLAAIGSFLGRGPVPPESLRRNLVVSGINLLSLRDRVVQIGSAVLQVSGICAPCSRMEEAFGNGGYSAVRGHGGVTARTVKPGVVEVGDDVFPIDEVDLA